MRLVPLAVVAVGLLAAGCAAPSRHVGDGPVRLSPDVRAFYDSYRKGVNPLAFAVSRDGRAAGAVICPEFGGCHPADEVRIALRNCRRSGGEECFIYDLNGKVVWRDANLPGLST